MKRTSLRHHPCSVARALDVAGEWWTLLVLRDVAYGIRRFSEIQEDLGISANVLADRLETLVAEGLMEQRAYQERPERLEYHLTEKGQELVPVLLALMRWGDKWEFEGGRGPVRVVHRECGHEVAAEVRCPQCEREVAPGELAARPRGRGTRPPREGEPGHVSAQRLLAAKRGVPLGG